MGHRADVVRRSFTTKTQRAQSKKQTMARERGGPRMEGMNTTSTAAPRRYPGRLWLAVGLGLPVLAVIGYAVQIAAQRLTTPWYLPAATALGAALLIVALWRARTVWRVLALLVVLLLAGAEGALLLGARLPAYTGPVAEGRPFPAFETKRADGAAFTQRDLEGGQNNVLVFFRGRW